MKEYLKTGFTLAEVLIILTIIGILATITLPALLTRINKILDKNQNEIVQDKLINSLNLMDAHGEINNTYESTSDFVNNLSKYLKIIKVCDSESIKECFPYDSVNYVKDKNLKTKSLDEITTAGDIYLNKGKNSITNFMSPVGLLLGNGISMILSYNKDCISDPDSINEDNKKIHSCVAGIYDFNGKNKPNSFGVYENSTRSDLVAFGGASLTPTLECSEIKLTDGSIACVSEVIAPNSGYKPLDCSGGKNEEYCVGNYSSSGYSSDYWAGARKACDDLGGKLPDTNILSEIVKANLKLSATNRILPTDFWVWGATDTSSTYGSQVALVRGEIRHDRTKNYSGHYAVCAEK